MIIYCKFGFYHELEIFPTPTHNTFGILWEEPEKPPPSPYLVLSSMEEGYSHRHYPQIEQMFRSYLTCIQLGRNWIKEHFPMVTTIVFLTFRDVLLESPTLPGEYYSWMNAHSPPFFYPVLENIELISEHSIRYQGKSLSFYELDSSLRQKILLSMFQGRVIEEEQLEKIPCHSMCISIPSVCYTSDQPLDYTPQRSIFSSRDRISQTKKQIASLSGKGYSVFLCEGGFLSLYDMISLLYVGDSDFKIILFHSQSSQYHAHQNPNKSVFEIHVLRTLLSKVEGYSWFCKFGGRYRLLKNTSLELFQQNTIVYQEIPSPLTYTKRPMVECILYSIPCVFIPDILLLFQDLQKRLEEKHESVEHEMWNLFQLFPTTKIERLGIVGMDAVYGIMKLL